MRNVVLCDALPPTCAAGFTPVVAEGCWGPCVRASHCQEIPCLEGRCPGNLVCDRAGIRCFSPGE
ncbi:MAG: hypothetical protein Q8Q09_26725 [Deltaproteobacteria bacterium]|nr:hypothetical protein [Deltaproteobacteria bacterium]